MSVRLIKKLDNSKKLIAFHEYSPGFSFLCLMVPKIYNKWAEFLEKNMKTRLLMKCLLQTFFAL